MTLPPGYRGPEDPARDRDQVMSDVVAQNLIAEIVALHEALGVRLDHEVELAAQGPGEQASGFVSGGREHDQMALRAAAIREAERERTRQLKNAREELRRVIGYYKRRVGGQPATSKRHRPQVQSIDYQAGGARRYG